MKQEVIESSAIREDLECRTGVVEAVEGEQITVRIVREKSCNACASKAQCGALFGTDTTLQITADPVFEKGDTVEIGLNPSAILSASTLFFVLPVVLFLIGVVGGYSMSPLLSMDRQWTGFIGGVVLMGLGFLGVWLMGPKLAASQKYEPVITRKLESAQASSVSSAKR